MEVLGGACGGSFVDLGACREWVPGFGTSETGFWTSELGACREWVAGYVTLSIVDC